MFTGRLKVIERKTFQIGFYLQSLDFPKYMEYDHSGVITVIMILFGQVAD